MITEDQYPFYLFLVILSGCLFAGLSRKRMRRRKFARGRRLSRYSRFRFFQGVRKGALRWGVLHVPENEATQHFLTVGGTGSGKSLLQRLLMRDVLRAIRPNSDRRALIFDAKGDTAEFLQQTGVTCPIYSLNPFQAEHPLVQQAAWDVAADITSPARALNLAATLIPAQPKDSNRYFSDAARQVLAGVVESFIRHSPGDWSFADLVLATESRETVETILSRDRHGQLIVRNFLGDDRTAYQVFTTLASRMAYFRTVAARWRDFSVKLSLREWLQQESVLMIGSNAAMQTALEAVNEIVFRVLVEEVDEQRDSDTRRTWFWMDEARLSGPLLRSSLIPYLCVKGRSRGVCLVLSFQDLDGFKEAAGEQIAHEIIAQCSHKAILRMESPSGSSWASSMIGGNESLEVFRSVPFGWGRGGTGSEQLTKRDTVLASEFSQIPFTSRANGLTGYFISPRYGVVQGVLKSSTLSPIAPGRIQTASIEHIAESEQTQWLAPWSESDRQRLHIASEPPRLAEPAKHRSTTYRKGNVFQWDGFPQGVHEDAT